MTNVKKYHDLLDKLTVAIEKGNTNLIEQLKDKIEKTENQIYLDKIKKRKDK